jgi:Ser/Thr protein kinase RdoA (MazF antagonist)
MRHLTRAGVETVPRLRETPGGETLVADRRGRMWELMTFVAGLPTAAPSPPQAEAAAAALARLHRPPRPSRRGRPPPARASPTGSSGPEDCSPTPGRRSAAG